MVSIMALIGLGCAVVFLCWAAVVINGGDIVGRERERRSREFDRYAKAALGKIAYDPDDYAENEMCRKYGRYWDSPAVVKAELWEQRRRDKMAARMRP